MQSSDRGASGSGDVPPNHCHWCSVFSLHLAVCPCEGARYCSVACQEQHWPEHSQLCQHGRRAPPALTACTACGLETTANMWCQCFTVLYCSPACQRRHWDAAHHRVCKPLYTHDGKNIRSAGTDSNAEPSSKLFDLVNSLKLQRQ